MNIWKTVSSSILLFLCSYLTLAQDIEFASHFKSDQDSRIEKIAIDDNGDTYIFGTYAGTLTFDGNNYPTNGSFDLFLAKILATGEPDWIQTFGSAKTELVVDVRFTQSGKLFACGAFWDTCTIDTIPLYSPNVRSVFISEFNPSNGNVVWAKNVVTSTVGISPTTFSLGINDTIYLSGKYVFDAIFESITYTWNGTLNSFTAVFDSNGNEFGTTEYITKNNNSSISSFFQASNGYFIGGRYIDSLFFRNDTLYNDGTQTDAFVGFMDWDYNLLWSRRIYGTGNDYVQNFESINQDFYLTGYSNSSELYFETEFPTPITKYNSGGDDVYIAKYNTTGSILWATTIGSPTGDMRSFDLSEVENDILVTGFFTDTIIWGNDTLKSRGPADRDVFSIRCNKAQGLPISSLHISFDTLNSEDYGRSVGSYQGEIYIAAITDAPTFTLGDSTYSGTPGFQSAIFAIYGCRAFSVDNVIKSDIETCFNDSTGAIQISASGGFGEPYLYSIDGGQSYQNNDPVFSQLPAGDYSIFIRDKAGCPESYGIVSLSQPDSLIIVVENTEDITDDSDGLISVAASGGTLPYTYTLQPGDVSQDIGTYTFGPGEEGTYVVQVDDDKNCGPVETDSIEIRNTVGVDYTSAFDVKIYPNPASGMVTLELPFDDVECTLEVLSLTGQVMLSRQVYSSGGIIHEIIDVSDLSKGMYMLRVDGQTLKSKIVVH